MLIDKKLHLEEVEQNINIYGCSGTVRQSFKSELFAK